MGIKSQGKGQDDEQGVAIPYTLAMLCCPFFLVFLKGIFNSSEVFDKIAEQDIYKNISRTESLVQLQDSNEKDPYRLFLENVMKTTYELQIIATRKINKGRLKIIL